MVSPTPPLPAQKYEYNTYSTSGSFLACVSVEFLASVSFAASEEASEREASREASRFCAIISAAITFETPGYTPAVVIQGTPASAACFDLAFAFAAYPASSHTSRYATPFLIHASNTFPLSPPPLWKGPALCTTKSAPAIKAAMEIGSLTFTGSKRATPVKFGCL